MFYPKSQAISRIFCDYEEKIPPEKQTASYIKAKQTERLNSRIPAERQKQKPPSLLLELAESTVNRTNSAGKLNPHSNLTVINSFMDKLVPTTARICKMTQIPPKESSAAKTGTLQRIGIDNAAQLEISKTHRSKSEPEREVQSSLSTHDKYGIIGCVRHPNPCRKAEYHTAQPRASFPAPEVQSTSISAETGVIAFLSDTSFSEDENETVRYRGLYSIEYLQKISAKRLRSGRGHSQQSQQKAGPPP
ncbi:MAG: hypothetical protein ACLTXT_04370 [Ruminococcus callidus]